jgi:phosphatidylglycerol:prolipoprotein diacylglycerol transferase
VRPVLFEIGPLTVYTYGFFVSLAALCAFFLAQRRAAAMGLERSAVADLTFFVFVSGVVGARLFYVLQHAERYRHQWAQAFLICEGGLVWYGGFLLAAAAGLLYARARRWPAATLCDLAAPIVPMAHAIGRLGCFMNGCCAGRPSEAWWAVTYPGDVPRHPVQLYEAAALALLSLALFRYRPRRPGDAFLAYALAYAALRFALEFLRGDQTLYGPLTIPQWTSLALFAGALALFLRRPPGHARR